MTMGIALREIGNSQVVVLLRAKTSEIKNTVVPVNPNPGREKEGARVVSLMGEDNVRLRAVSFREIRDTDVWEFRVPEKNPETGIEVMTLWYVKGDDILFVMAMSKVI